MFKNTLRYFDFRYYLRFAGLFFLFYLTYTFVIAASAPTGTYFPFVDKFLNFPLIIRYCVLHIGHALLAVFGYPTSVDGGRLISHEGLSILEMAWACYGLGVKSFWIAFVCAHQMPLKQKVYWSLTGVLTIFLLNCVRVVVMMIAMVEKWTVAEYLGTNAHDLFNYLSYAALFGLILLFYAKVKTKQYPEPASPLKA
jgi:exosortase/archaeosortase family protein